MNFFYFFILYKLRFILFSLQICERMAMGIKKEVEILAALNGGPNTVKFHDAFEDVEIIYIVME